MIPDLSTNSSSLGTTFEIIYNTGSNEVYVRSNVYFQFIRILSASGISQMELKELHTKQILLDVQQLSPGTYRIEAFTEEGKLMDGKLVRE